MPVNLPPKPDINSVNTQDQGELLAYQEASQAYWFAVNLVSQAQNREGEAQSNLEKANDTALQSIIGNMKQ